MIYLFKKIKIKLFLPEGHFGIDPSLQTSVLNKNKRLLYLILLQAMYRISGWFILLFYDGYRRIKRNLEKTDIPAVFYIWYRTTILISETTGYPAE